MHKTKLFDKGGIMAIDSSGSGPDMAVLEDLNTTLANLQKYGIMARTVLSQHNDTADRLKAIQDDATMK